MSDNTPSFQWDTIQTEEQLKWATYATVIYKLGRPPTEEEIKEGMRVLTECLSSLYYRLK